jgi:murein DD-endopeptidase MepM/ murein hydrolase activator NlpD
MADAKGGAFGEVEGDYSVVKVQLAGGGKEGKPARPTKGTQLVWGGTDVSSPWGHLAALIEKGGGSVNYTYVHAADLKAPLLEVEDEGVTTSDEQAEDAKPAQQQKTDGKTDEKKTEPRHSTGGAEGHGPLFDDGVDFQFAGNTARVWAHPHAFMYGPRPLVIALHGINGKSHKLHPALDEHGTHVGKLVGKLIEDGKVTPLLIAAPTEFSDGPWRTFDVAKFVAAVKAAVASQSVEIDEDQVSLVGHSGAGGSRGAGLNKIAEQGGVFDGHNLKLFGITDTCITSENAKAYADGLKDNKTTAIYALHKGTGGWKAYGGSQQFASALGAGEIGKATEPPEDSQDVDDHVYDNGGKTPLRCSIRVNDKRLPAHHKEWKEAGGYHVDVGAHNDMVPMWFWWAMPRFCPATEADKTAGLKAHDQPAPEHDEPAKPSITGGEWADVPPAAPPWEGPGVDPKPNATAIFAPPSGLYWPVRQPKSSYGRAVSYLGDDNKGYGAGKGTSDRHFLAGRPAGAQERFHCGIDVYGDHHDIIVACEAGVVVNEYWFFPPDKPLVKCLIVQHDSGVVINYGEVDPESLKKYGIKKGVRVAPGQPIAEVGRMVHDSMLHFETYPSGATRNVSIRQDKAATLLRSIYNPTQYLLSLAKTGK